MRKQTIWLIGIVLLIAFAGLLVMQFTYLSEIVSTREEQFDEAAKRALFGTMRQLERQETRKYLDEYYDDAEKQALSQLNQENPTSSVTTSGSISVQGPDGSVSTFKFQSNVGGDTLSQHHFEMQPRSNRNIQSRQRAMQDMLLGQYMYQRNLLDDVVFRIISQTNDKPIMERLDLEQLRRTLTEEMQSAGYNLDYEFCIVERDGSVAYRSAGYKAEEAEKEGSYMQMLFPRSQMAQDYGKAPSRVSYMEVYFPGRHRLLMNSGLHFMIPSFVFTLVMLMLFIFVIYVVFRQKKLSEIICLDHTILDEIYSLFDLPYLYLRGEKAVYWEIWSADEDVCMATSRDISRYGELGDELYFVLTKWDSDANQYRVEFNFPSGTYRLLLRNFDEEITATIKM